MKKYLLNWLNNWSKLESPIKGDDLLARGWKPGPDIGIEIKPVGYSGRVVWQSVKPGLKTSDVKICELKMEWN